LISIPSFVTILNEVAGNFKVDGTANANRFVRGGKARKHMAHGACG
jgi:hypothetical protein